MARSRGLLLATVCLLGLSLVVPAAGGATTFHARIGKALGLIPPFTSSGKPRASDVGTGSQTPTVYHAGQVMAGGVTVHTIFWAPPGYAFQGAPPGAPGDYKAMIEQFFVDAAHDSGASGTCTAAECNSLSVLPQFAEGTRVGAITPGSYSINYAPAADAIVDTNPYPPQSSQCASPSGVATCLTDGQLSAEVDRIVQGTPGTPRGLTNLWFVFLPPSVDECIDPSSCGTNTFAGYHSVENAGHGPTIYAVAIDPLIELTLPPGADPENYPDAEATIDTAAHETVEAITDPEGSGWMDPNGNEVADKCETQNGSPLGFASNGSPYNQVINGHQYLFQEMWANAGNSGSPGCVQATTTTSNQLPLPQVNLRQFNPVVTGNVNRQSGGGIGVSVSLLRADAAGDAVTVARAATKTAANGSWSVSLGSHAPGDDRDQIEVVYSGPGAPIPSREVIQTGNGGDPLNEAGWTGWFAMDTGSAATRTSLTVAPCFQAGQLSAFLNSSPLSTPTDFCNTQTDAATVPVSNAGARDRLTYASNDNRAFQAPSAPIPNLQGALVSLTVPVGEPGSVFCIPGSSPCTAPFTSSLTFFTPGGFPSCAVDLELQEAECSGLVPKGRYTLADGRARASGVADASGAILEPLVARRGSTVTLSNGSRTVATLQVARLRVDLAGDQTTVAGGSCQPGDYWGAPLATPPTSTSAGTPSSSDGGGSALTGSICPLDGDPAGLSTSTILQSDDRSGGQTQVEVPEVLDTSPIDGENLYGKFTALATSGLVLPDNSLIPTDSATRVSFEILTSITQPPVFKAANVDTDRGVTVTGLKPGSYLALWTLRDVNGDTRTFETRFAEQLGSGPKATVACRIAGAQRRLIACDVRYPQIPAPNGTVRVRIARGGTIVSLGHGRVSKGKANVRMRRLNTVTRGPWRITLVLSQAHKRPETVNLSPQRVV